MKKYIFNFFKLFFKIFLYRLYIYYGINTVKKQSVFHAIISTESVYEVTGSGQFNNKKKKRKKLFYVPGSCRFAPALKKEATEKHPVVPQPKKKTRNKTKAAPTTGPIHPKPVCVKRRRCSGQQRTRPSNTAWHCYTIQMKPHRGIRTALTFYSPDRWHYP